MIDENWDRWIQASINLYYKTALDLIPMPMYLEGQELDLSGAKWTEIRTRGPNYILQPGNFYDIELLLNICLTIKRPTSGTYDGYIKQRMVGKIKKLMEIPLNVKKYGDGEAFVLCLNPESKIDTINWGEMTVGGASPIRADQTTLELSYTGQLHGT